MWGFAGRGREGATVRGVSWVSMAGGRRGGAGRRTGCPGADAGRALKDFRFCSDMGSCWEDTSGKRSGISNYFGWSSLTIQWLGLYALTAEGLGSTLGQGTKNPTGYMECLSKYIKKIYMCIYIYIHIYVHIYEFIYI